MRRCFELVFWFEYEVWVLGYGDGEEVDGYVYKFEVEEMFLKKFGFGGVVSIFSWRFDRL